MSAKIVRFRKGAQSGEEAYMRRIYDQLSPRRQAMFREAVEALASGEEDMEPMLTDHLIELGVPPDTARQRARESLAKTDNESWRNGLN